MKLIVVAGGQGTKLWPYSREGRPKQFQAVVGNTTLYADTINVLLKRFAPEDIYISTKRKFIKYVSEQTPQIPLRNYIVEPDAAKDRGPGEGLAFLRLSVLHPDEPFFVVQSDCMRKPEDAFLQMIEEAGKIVQRDKRYITGGIKATQPDMGIDYLQLGAQVNDSKEEMYEVKAFLGRKSSYRETKELINNFHIVTHSNHSCWYPDLMLEAYRKYRPDWYKALMKMREAFDKPGEDAAIERIYGQMEKGATEEVTKQVMAAGEARIILLPFKWTDIGTWGSVYEFFGSSNSSDNYEDGNVVTVDTRGSLIKSNNPKKLIAVAGMQDMVIVDTDDVLLVISKDQIEKIKELQAQLKEKRKEYL